MTTVQLQKDTLNETVASWWRYAREYRDGWKQNFAITWTEQNNDAVRLSSANEYYLKCDGYNWMRGDLSSGGFRVRGMANPKTDQDVVTLKTCQDSEMYILEQASAAVDTAVNDAIRNHGIAVENAVAGAAGIFRGGRTDDVYWNQHKTTDLADLSDDGDAVHQNILDREIRTKLWTWVWMVLQKFWAWIITK